MTKKAKTATVKPAVQEPSELQLQEAFLADKAQAEDAFIAGLGVPEFILPTDQHGNLIRRPVNKRAADALTADAMVANYRLEAKTATGQVLTVGRHPADMTKSQQGLGVWAKWESNQWVISVEDPVTKLNILGIFSDREFVLLMEHVARHWEGRTLGKHGFTEDAQLLEDMAEGKRLTEVYREKLAAEKLARGKKPSTGANKVRVIVPAASQV